MEFLLESNHIVLLTPTCLSSSHTVKVETEETYWILLFLFYYLYVYFVFKEKRKHLFDLFEMKIINTNKIVVQQNCLSHTNKEEKN